MTILAWLSGSREHFGGTMSMLAVVVFRVVGQQHAQAVADGDAGSDDQESVGEAVVLGLASLLRACQAMSIAMTTVLPLPVAILNAMRGSSGLCHRWRRLQSRRIQAPPCRSATSVR